MLKYAITGKYEQIVQKLEDYCGESDCGYVKKPQSILSRFQPAGTNAECFDCWLYLRDWKERSSSGKNRIDILLHVQETIERPGRLLLRSTVHVNYYQINGDKASLLQSVHFDYGQEDEDGQEQTAHPFFHAHITSEQMQLAPEDAAELGFDRKLTNDEARCLRDSRIPTSDMTFPSVLLCLAANHFAKDHFLGFRNELIEIQNQMPQPAFDAIRASLRAESSHLRSSHWFAHF